MKFLTSDLSSYVNQIWNNLLDILQEIELFRINSYPIKPVVKQNNKKVLLNYKSTPRYQLVWEDFRHGRLDKMLCIKDNYTETIIITTITQLEKDLAMIVNLASDDAYRLGKEAGIRERILEEEIIRQHR